MTGRKEEKELRERCVYMCVCVCYTGKEERKERKEGRKEGRKEPKARVKRSGKAEILRLPRNGRCFHDRGLGQDI